MLDPDEMNADPQPCKKTVAYGIFKLFLYQHNIKLDIGSNIAENIEKQMVLLSFISTFCPVYDEKIGDFSNFLLDTVPH
jgi:hypothetical protein